MKIFFILLCIIGFFYSPETLAIASIVLLIILINDYCKARRARKDQLNRLNKAIDERAKNI